MSSTLSELHTAGEDPESGPLQSEVLLLAAYHVV